MSIPKLTRAAEKHAESTTSMIQNLDYMEDETLEQLKTLYTKAKEESEETYKNLNTKDTTSATAIEAMILIFKGLSKLFDTMIEDRKQSTNNERNE